MGCLGVGGWGGLGSDKVKQGIVMIVDYFTRKDHFTPRVIPVPSC